MASSAVATLVDVNDYDMDEESSVPVDLTSLSAEKRDALNVAVAQWRTSVKRMVSEIYVMSGHLAEMREILGSKPFFRFAIQTLGLNRKTVTRYLHCHSVLKAHFQVDGDLIPGITDRLTQDALQVLSPTTDQSVVDEVKQAIGDGTKVNARYIEDVIARHTAEKDAELASGLAQAEAAKKAIERRLEQTELELARTRRDMNAQTEMLRRKQETTELLEQENQELRSANVEVRFQTKEVPVIPPGFKSVEDAIASRQATLNALAEEETRRKQDLAAIEQEHIKAHETFSQIAASAGEFRALKEQVESIIGRFPMATLAEVAKRESSIKQAYATLGKTLVLFGEQLVQAGE